MCPGRWAEGVYLNVETDAEGTRGGIGTLSSAGTVLLSGGSFLISRGGWVKYAITADQDQAVKGVIG